MEVKRFYGLLAAIKQISLSKGESVTGCYCNIKFRIIALMSQKGPQKGRFSCRGMLDFDEENKFDVVLH